MAALDIVTIFHNDKNFAESTELWKQIREHEPVGDYTFNVVDNQADNRGFSRGCNVGAVRGDSPIIGFLNPDAQVTGPFIDAVVDVLAQHPEVVITGCDHGKPQREVQGWGLRNWVCGCTMFVRRDWFDEVGGFDERYIWSFEDTDLCRQAEAQGHKVMPIDLPLEHESPDENSPEDIRYKQRNFALANEQFWRKWRAVRR